MHNLPDSRTFYRQIVDASFQAHVPGWGGMSPWDPMKVLAESLEEILARIEQQQHSLVETLLNSLPSLVGFSAHAARLPTISLEIKPASKLRTSTLLEKGTVLRFRNEENLLYARTLADFTVQPTSDSVSEVAAEIYRVQEELDLQELRGVPWERIPLPKDLVEIPSKLFLHLPDERVIEFDKEDTSLLSIRAEDPQRFSKCFFYNSVRHEVILPFAAEASREFSGGVRVRLRDCVLDPGATTLPESSAYCSDYPKVIGAVSQFRSLSEGIPKESPQAYLDRFYALVRELPRRPQAAVYPNALCQAIAGVDSRIRRVEHAVSSSGELVFYLLAVENSAELLERADDCLRKICPIQTPFRVEFFYSTLVKLNEPNPSLVREMQPPPLGRLEVGREIQFDSLLNSVRIGNEGRVVSSLKREPGQLFVFEVENTSMEINHAG